MATPEEMAEEIVSLKSQLALLSGAAVGIATEAYRSETRAVRCRPSILIGNLAQILESLPFLQNLPAARPYLKAMAEARQDAAKGEPPGDRDSEIRTWID